MEKHKLVTTKGVLWIILCLAAWGNAIFNWDDPFWFALATAIFITLLAAYYFYKRYKEE